MAGLWPTAPRGATTVQLFTGFGAHVNDGLPHPAHIHDVMQTEE